MTTEEHYIETGHNRFTQADIDDPNSYYCELCNTVELSAPNLEGR